MSEQPVELNTAYEKRLGSRAKYFHPVSVVWTLRSVLLLDALMDKILRPQLMPTDTEK